MSVMSIREQAEADAIAVGAKQSSPDWLPAPVYQVSADHIIVDGQIVPNPVGWGDALLQMPHTQ